MLSSQTSRISAIPIRIGSERSKPAPLCVQVVLENHSDWISEPATSPLIESTIDQPIQ